MKPLIFSMLLASAIGAGPAVAAGEDGALAQGRAALEAGRAEEAVRHFEAAVAEAPESAEASWELSRALVLLQRLDEARVSLSRAAELDPGDARFHVGLGDLSLTQGQPEEALVHFRAALELDDSIERARLGEVQALHALHRYAEVVERLELAHEELPRSGLVAYGLAWMLAASPDPALRDGPRALDLAQSVFESHQSLPNAELVAEALGEVGRCEKAAEWLRGIRDTVLDEAAPAAATERLEQGIARFSAGPPCRAPVGSESGTGH